MVDSNYERAVKKVGRMPFIHGEKEFEIEPGKAGEPWHAGNGRIGVTVYPSDRNTDPTTTLVDVPALLFKSQRMHLPMGNGGDIPHKTQVLIGELNGVFMHLQERDGMVHIILADKRLG